MRIDIFHHFDKDDHSAIHAKLDRILEQGRILMSAADDMKAELVEINNSTNEIAADIDDLIARVGEGSLSPAEAAEVKDQLTALKTRLTGIAATHTPTTT